MSRASASDSPSPQVWHVYLVRCADDTLYCGVTTDLKRRVAEHNGERPGGARYTRPRRPVTLVASCPCRNRSAACSLEQKVKKVPRVRKIDFLQKTATLLAVS